MKYTLYALFREPQEADAAVRDIETAGLAPGEYRLVMHRDGMKEDDLAPPETDSWRGMIIGIGIGTIGGMILGLLLAGPLNLLPVGLAAAALACGAVGAVIAGLGATLYGAGLAHPKVQQLNEKLRPGRVLITAETNSLGAREAVEQIVRRHGAVPA